MCVTDSCDVLAGSAVLHGQSGLVDQFTSSLKVKKIDIKCFFQYGDVRFFKLSLIVGGATDKVYQFMMTLSKVFQQKAFVLRNKHVLIEHYRKVKF